MDDVARFKLERKKCNSRLTGGGHFQRDPWAVSGAAVHGVVKERVIDACRSIVRCKRRPRKQDGLSRSDSKEAA